MKSRYALIVVGGGPAGMAAAQRAAGLGLDVAILDEQDRPGGQIYRGLEDSPLRDPAALGADYFHGARLIRGLREARVDYLARSSVWNIGPRLEVCAVIDGVGRELRGERIILATGAQERPMPVPGWQLPGVMTAGAGQILLKAAAMKPAGDAVLAGSGPLLLLLAWQYLKLGVAIRALVDTTPRGNYFAAARHLAGAVGAPAYLLKGLRFTAAIRRKGVPVYTGIDGLEARGAESLESVSFSSRGGPMEIAAGTLLLHMGVIPQLHLSMAAGCDTRWDESQLCWRPAVDAWGGSTVPGVFVAGDSSGIVGALASELQGRLAALRCAFELGALPRERCEREAARIRRALRKHLRIRPFLDALFRPSRAFLAPPDETMVCRCEEVSAAEIRALARLGCDGPNQAKAFSRCGMGPCQGRQCGDTVASLIAEVRGRHVAEVGAFRVRPPVKPVTLGQMGALADGCAADE